MRARLPTPVFPTQAPEYHKFFWSCCNPAAQHDLLSLPQLAAEPEETLGEFLQDWFPISGLDAEPFSWQLQDGKSDSVRQRSARAPTAPFIPPHLSHLCCSLPCFPQMNGLCDDLKMKWVSRNPASICLMPAQTSPHTERIKPWQTRGQKNLTEHTPSPAVSYIQNIFTCKRQQFSVCTSDGDRFKHIGLFQSRWDFGLAPIHKTRLKMCYTPAVQRVFRAFVFFLNHGSY